MHSPNEPLPRPIFANLLPRHEFNPDDPRGIARICFDNPVPTPVVRALLIDLIVAGTDATIACRVAETVTRDGISYTATLVPVSYNDHWTEPDWVTLSIQASYIDGRKWVEDVSHVDVHWHDGSIIRLENASATERPDSGASTDPVDPDVSRGIAELLARFDTVFEEVSHSL